MTQIPGFEANKTGVIVVALNGVDPNVSRDSVGVVWGADDVVSAWGTG